MLYSILKWIHVLAAVLAVGANATYGVWITRAARRPQDLSFTLRGIQWIDDRMANPAYALSLVSGLLMVWVGRLNLATPWLLTSLVLYVLLVLLGLLGYTPTLRQQIRALESQGPDAPRYQALARRGIWLGIILAVLAMAVLFLMVVKPPLWA
ncbi:MAG: DUF2269 family protein [Chloroflexi bacterium]|jgi:uncharacterized membrane protein|nr:DUF2269 family protein [Anaerolineaceae bacterium]NMB90529.1 DUF2269 family protein [Chloroflexota bacterium]